MRSYRGGLLLIALVFTACSSGTHVSSTDVGASRLRVSVSPAIAGEANTVTVESNDVSVAAAAVEMPDMPMPAKVYELHASGAHRYEASDVQFTMAGTWRVTILDGAAKRISSFTIVVR